MQLTREQSDLIKIKELKERDFRPADCCKNCRFCSIDPTYKLKLSCERFDVYTKENWTCDYSTTK
jgi:hypothetical protein